MRSCHRTVFHVQEEGGRVCKPWRQFRSQLLLLHILAVMSPSFAFFFGNVIQYPPRLQPTVLPFGCTSDLPLAQSERPLLWQKKVKAISGVASLTVEQNTQQSCEAIPIQQSSIFKNHGQGRRQKQKIRSVPWTRSILPHQQYSGILDRNQYNRWLLQGISSFDDDPTSSSSPQYSVIASSKNNVIPTKVTASHLKPIYVDDDIIVVHKPSGILSVPGPSRHECITTLAYRYFGKSQSEINAIEKFRFNKKSIEVHEDMTQSSEIGNIWRQLNDFDNKLIDTMVVHRLDRDTSGVFLMARNENALKNLHKAFKDKSNRRVSKIYVALVCGHWNGAKMNADMNSDDFSPSFAIDEGEIDLPLVRDMDRPPFMRVATVETETQQQSLKESNNCSGVFGDLKRRKEGFVRMVGKAAKPSLTNYRILSYEYLIDDECISVDSGNQSQSTRKRRILPVTRVELRPVTGRTHQLRVHCASQGHPIVGDSIYGYQGEGNPLAGLRESNRDDTETIGASFDLQRRIHDHWTSRWKRKSTVNMSERVTDDNCSAQDAREDCFLCLHSWQLTIFHPLTGAPMMFESDPPF
ncbi:hypothetical protein ACHAXS_001594 [Conticribra weissflogii]